MRLKSTEIATIAAAGIPSSGSELSAFYIRTATGMDINCQIGIGI